MTPEEFHQHQIVEHNRGRKPSKPMPDLNDNERRGLPADIDLLIRSAQQVVNCYRDGRTGPTEMTDRINNLNKITGRVGEQYQKIIEQKS